MKRRFGKSKYKEKVIGSKEIFTFKKLNKVKYNYSCPEIAKAVKILLEKYKEMTVNNSNGVVLGSAMGSLSIQYLHDSKKDYSKPLGEGDYASYLNFGTNGKTAKVVWSIENSKKQNTMSKLLRFDAHTSLAEKAKIGLRDNPYKYKTIRCQQK